MGFGAALPLVARAALALPVRLGALGVDRAWEWLLAPGAALVPVDVGAVHDDPAARATAYAGASLAETTKAACRSRLFALEDFAAALSAPPERLDILLSVWCGAMSHSLKATSVHTYVATT